MTKAALAKHEKLFANSMEKGTKTLLCYSLVRALAIFEEGEGEEGECGKLVGEVKLWLFSLLVRKVGILRLVRF